jgi:hypothetical protein
MDTETPAPAEETEPQPGKDPQREAQRESAERQRARLRDVQRTADDEDRTGDELIEAAAKGRKLGDDEVEDATAWLLSDASDQEEAAKRTLQVNVGSDDDPTIVGWTIRAIDGDELSGIQKIINNPRELRRAGGEPDQFDMHARTVIAATLDPDLRAAAREQGMQKRPSEWLRRKFIHKPGLIPQLAAEIMQLSGFDDTHVREQAGKG